MTDKHAYLIMAHKNTYVLEKMLELIDDIRNDIFVHIDVKCNDFDFERYKTLIKKSNLIFLECRMDVRWGVFTSTL